MVIIIQDLLNYGMNTGSLSKNHLTDPFIYFIGDCDEGEFSMYMMLYGSRAIQHWFPDFYREPLDFDYMITKDFETIQRQHLESQDLHIEDLPHGFYIRDNGVIIEYKLASTIEEELMDLIKCDPKTDIRNEGRFIPSAEVLLAMKMTHRFKKNTPHFMKTMRDIYFLRRKRVGLPDPELYGDIFQRLEKYTLSYGKPSLDQKKNEFFKMSDQERYGHNYEHDDLHVAVALFDKPAYTYYMQEDHPVMCDQDKWDSCSEAIKIAGVYEETAVLALERSLISNEFKHDPERIFRISLEKVCTGITSGWFREYAWENYLTVYGLAKQLGFDRMQKCFEKGLENGIVREREAV